MAVGVVADVAEVDIGVDAVEELDVDGVVG